MRLRPAFALTVAASGLAVVAGCGGSSPSASPSTASTSPTPSGGGAAVGAGVDEGVGTGSAAPGGTAPGQGVVPGASSGTGGTGGTDGTGGTGGTGGGGGTVTATPSTPGTAAPRIVSFAVTQQPSCPEGEGPYRSPGSPAVVSWVVTGATSVTLSVDGPGAYGTYGPTGSVTLPFGCGAVGTTTTHTYTVTANGATGSVTRTISASATQR